MLELKGTTVLIKNLNDAKVRASKGLERGLAKAGHFLLMKARELAPVDTGKLWESGFVLKQGYGDKTKITVGFNTPYALIVHEDLDAKHAEGKSAKYLEIPTRLYADEIQKIIADEVRKWNENLGVAVERAESPKVTDAYLKEHAFGKDKK